MFHGDAPSDAVWRLWQARGWVREAGHYLQLGRNVECKLCPNECILEPGDRSHCRNKINRDGTLYTLAYANPCTVHRLDPDREEAAVPLPARHSGVFPGHVGLRLSLPELPELGDLPGQARGYSRTPAARRSGRPPRSWKTSRPRPSPA